jgi:hypothetical protein
MNRYYEDAKHHYENTKPIRGRNEDIRPAGKRRYDWEKITNPAPEAYAYKLYDTDCITYEPSRITLACGHWMSPLTAKFITKYSPFPCIKARNNLWVNTGHNGNVGWYPIYKQLFIDIDADGQFKPQINPVPVRSVNRTKAKELRARIEPFIKYGTAILKLSDGWVTHKFRTEVRESILNSDWVRILREQMTLNDLIDTPEDLLPYYFVQLTHHMQSIEDKRVSDDWRERDRRYDPKAFRRAAHHFHDLHDSNVYKVEHRMPDGNLFDNIVPWNP